MHLCLSCLCKWLEELCFTVAYHALLSFRTIILFQRAHWRCEFISNAINSFLRGPPRRERTLRVDKKPLIEKLNSPNWDKIMKGWCIGKVTSLNRSSVSYLPRSITACVPSTINNRQSSVGMEFSFRASRLCDLKRFEVISPPIID